MDTVKFPCGQQYALGELTASHRLVPTGLPDLWSNGKANAFRSNARQFCVEFGGRRYLDSTYLNAREHDFAGGSWIGGEPMAMILTNDGEDLVLSIYRAEMVV